jgi:CheY-like chemotaxis protein
MSETVAAPVVGGSTGDERGRLLIVDDNEDNRDMLSRRLARRGYVVELRSTVRQRWHASPSSPTWVPDDDARDRRFEVLERIGARARSPSCR